MSGKQLDVVGIGSLNIDFVLVHQRRRLLSREIRHFLSTTFDPGVEERIDNVEKIRDLINRIGKGNLFISPGGSAFNTILTLASMGLGLQCGYVGVAGRPDDGIDFRSIFSKLAVDDSFVKYDADQLCGVCFSCVTASKDRALMTSELITHSLGAHIEQHFDALADYVASARIVHLTSVFDDSSPEAMYDLVKEARSRNPALMISVDPGYSYLRDSRPYVAKWLSLADVCFLNKREFHTFAETETDYLEIARCAFRGVPNDSHVVLLKTYSSIHVFSMFRDVVYQQRYLNLPLPRFLVQDDTGAGDVFAAGFLAAQCLPVLRGDFAYAIRLGLSLVRCKLRFLGHAGIDRYPQIVERLLTRYYSRKYVNLKDFIATNISLLRSNVLAFVIGVVSSLTATAVLWLLLKRGQS